MMSQAETANVIRKVVPFFGLTFGILGNSLSFIVLNRPNIKKSKISSFVHMKVLAIADSAVILCLSIASLAQSYGNITLYLQSNSLCKLWDYMTFCSGDMAVWLLVAIAFDRTIAVVTPFKAKRICTPKKAIMIDIIMVVATMLKNITLLFDEVVTEPYAGNTNKTITACKAVGSLIYFDTNIRPWLSLVFYFFLPATLIFSCNVATTVALYRSQAQWNSKSQSINNNTGPKSKSVSSSTKMMMVVTIALTVLLSPSIILYTYNNLCPRCDIPGLSKGFLFALTDILVITNHSINFLLYIVSGRRFRREFIAMVTCKMAPDSQSENNKSRMKYSVSAKTPNEGHSTN